VDELGAGAAEASRATAARGPQSTPPLAAATANGFDDPRTLYPWWFEEREAQRLIGEKRGQQGRGFDRRQLRNALGQYATGVTVVTAHSTDGRSVGVTAKLLPSLSLEPPLVLWCLSRGAASLAAFQECTHFGVNVLSAGQHHLSRLFATSGADKFSSTEVRDGPAGVPLLAGALAQFVCRNVRQIEAAAT
jgi:flavin reductase (DIM6/NTAB) family NADH-FMN oxidoreductase RutF